MTMLNMTMEARHSKAGEMALHTEKGLQIDTVQITKHNNLNNNLNHTNHIIILIRISDCMSAHDFNCIAGKLITGPTRTRLK